MVLSFFVFLWFFIKREIKSQTSFKDKLKTFNDPLKNRARYAEAKFIKPAKALRKFYKKDLEKFCEWLESRIKIEGLWTIFGAVLLTLSPKIGTSLNKLFDDLASQPEVLISNPIRAISNFLHFEYLFVLIALMIIIMKVFIPLWMYYLHITKYAINHGYYRET